MNQFDNYLSTLLSFEDIADGPENLYRLNTAGYHAYGYLTPLSSDNPFYEDHLRYLLSTNFNPKNKRVFFRVPTDDEPNFGFMIKCSEPNQKAADDLKLMDPSDPEFDKTIKNLYGKYKCHFFTSDPNSINRYIPLLQHIHKNPDYSITAIGQERLVYTESIRQYFQFFKIYNVDPRIVKERYAKKFMPTIIERMEELFASDKSMVGLFTNALRTLITYNMVNVGLKNLDLGSLNLKQLANIETQVGMAMLSLKMQESKEPEEYLKTFPLQALVDLYYLDKEELLPYLHNNSVDELNRLRNFQSSIESEMDKHRTPWENFTNTCSYYFKRLYNNSSVGINSKLGNILGLFGPELDGGWKVIPMIGRFSRQAIISTSKGITLCLTMNKSYAEKVGNFLYNKLSRHALPRTLELAGFGFGVYTAYNDGSYIFLRSLMINQLSELVYEGLKTTKRLSSKQATYNTPVNISRSIQIIAGLEAVYRGKPYEFVQTTGTLAGSVASTWMAKRLNPDLRNLPGEIPALPQALTLHFWSNAGMGIFAHLTQNGIYLHNRSNQYKWIKRNLDENWDGTQLAELNMEYKSGALNTFFRGRPNNDTLSGDILWVNKSNNVFRFGEKCNIPLNVFPIIMDCKDGWVSNGPALSQ